MILSIKQKITLILIKNKYFYSEKEKVDKKMKEGKNSVSKIRMRFNKKFSKKPPKQKNVDLDVPKRKVCFINLVQSKHLIYLIFFALLNLKRL